MSDKKKSKEQNGAKSKATPEQFPMELEVPMDWHFPPDLQTRYANHMLVARTEWEYVLSFFEGRPPVIVGKTEEEMMEKVKAVKSVQAICVARIIVAKERMPAFIKALNTNLRRVSEELGASLGEDGAAEEGK